MSGHVFIIRGDLRKLACDAWLMSCDRRAQPGHFWFPEGYDGPRTGREFVEGESRVQPLRDAAPDRPRPWLCWVGRHRQPVSWFTDGAAAFLDAAATEIAARGTPPLFGRARSLLALPVVGTGYGGGARRAGEIVQALLPVLEAFVARTFAGGRRFDAALVCFDAASHAAAQAERATAEKAGRAVWPADLTPALRAEAAALAEHARRGELALFLGAGVSAGAGLPNWGELLAALARHAGMSDNEQEALSRLPSALDQASVVERWLDRRGERIGPAVAAVLRDRRHYAPAHALLAALPVREVITTNYDQLFDEAWRHTDPDGLSVLPGGVRPDARRWLLKMHGCLSAPARVVLTRESYIRYDEGLPALAGLVQAFLVTRQMLFVGFSLTDDNFHRLVDGVRRLRGEGEESAPFGTALALGDGGLAEVLWERDVRRVRMADRRLTRDEVPEAARRLDVFLDYLVFRTRDAAHLLVGERFDALLEPGEKALRDALQQFVNAVTGPGADEVRKTVAWPRVERLLRGLGFEPSAADGG